MPSNANHLTKTMVFSARNCNIAKLQLSVYSFTCNSVLNESSLVQKAGNLGAGSTFHAVWSFGEGLFVFCAHTGHYRYAMSGRKCTHHQFGDHLCDIIYVLNALPWYLCVSKGLTLLGVNDFFPLLLKVPEGRRNLNTTKINIVSLLGLHI